MKEFLELIPLLMAVGFGVAYMIERDKRLKAEADLRVVLKRKDLDGLGKKLDDTRSDYDSALGELGSGAGSSLSTDIPRDGSGYPITDNVSPGEMQEAAQAGEPPKHFKGIAQEDLGKGQACAIEVDPTTGTTRITAARVHTPFNRFPPSES